MKRINKYGLDDCYRRYLNNNSRFREAKKNGNILGDFVRFCNTEEALRIATIDNKEKLDKALDECLSEHGSTAIEFFNFLLEEIEVENEKDI